MEPSPASLLEPAKVLLSRTRQTYADHVQELLQQLQREVERYDGLPVAFNPFTALKLESFELLHQQMLAWLLDPKESHDLGDFMLRRLLARTERPACTELAWSAGSIEAIVKAECKLASGSADIVVLAPGVVLVLELKVGSFEGEWNWRGERRSQCAVYRLCLEDPALREEALGRISPEATAFVGDNPDVVSVFIRRADGSPSKDERTKSLSWLDIDLDLADAMRRRELEPERSAMLKAFRSTVLEYSGAWSPRMAEIETLRRWIDFPKLVRQRPVQAATALESLMKKEDAPMRDSLQRELDKLLVDNWGVVRALRARAEALRTEILDESRTKVFEHARHQEPKPGDPIKRGSSWMLPFTHGDYQYVSYIEVCLDEAEDPPKFTVYAGFGTFQGMRYSEVKERLPAELRSRFQDDWNDSARTVVTTQRKVGLDGSEPSAVAAAIATAAIDQLPVAYELYRVVTAWLGEGSGS